MVYNDEYFVIVILGGCTDYNEYAISLQDTRLFLQEDFNKILHKMYFLN